MGPSPRSPMRPSARVMSALGRRRSPLRPGVEALEDRLMLDAAVGSTTPAVVVGRTLSSYTVSGVVNDQETITYTVSNEQADDETGVLLTTTLQPGVTYASASIPPDQSGPDLAWSLGTIAGYDRASVSLTVNLPATPPTQLDGGAKAYATLDSASVTNSTPAATLSTATIPAGTLDSTPDANTTDPFVQEQAAKLSYDPQRIFDFLHAQVGYNSYSGSLRGARGTLWSGSGNALDVASLGVALMRASGIPSQYVTGRLPFDRSEALILSMFPASSQTVGYLPPGTSTAFPQSDDQTVNETQDHSWFQFDPGDGKGFRDADPLIAGATVGQSFATPTGTFTEVPDNLRQKTEIKLDAEMDSQIAAAFGLGGDGLSRTTVLDQTFNDVGLVGRVVTVGNLVTSSGGGFILSAQTNDYTPYLLVGDEALRDPEQPEPIFGTEYQEVLTNFPLASQVLTGLFLTTTFSGDGATPRSFDETLLDRIGYAARQGKAPTNVSVAPSSAPAISAEDLTSLNILPGSQNAGVAQLLQHRAAQQLAMVSQDSGASTVAKVSALIAFARAELANFAVGSDRETADLARGYSSAAYFNAPRITAFSGKVVTTGDHSDISYSFDLVCDSIRILAAPGQNAQAALGLAAIRGLFDSFLEAGSVPVAPGGVNLSSALLVQQSVQQGIPLVTIGPGNLSQLQSLDLPADATARITADVQGGLMVLVPSRALTIDGAPRAAWLAGDPTTGEIISKGQDGGHIGLEYVSLATIITTVVISAALNVAFGSLLPGPHTPQQYAKDAAYGAIGGLFPFGFLGLFGSLALTFLTSALGPLSKFDPPVAPFLVGLDIPFPNDPGTSADAPVTEPSNRGAGATSGTVRTASVAVSGGLAASWASSASSGFLASSLSVPAATIVDSSGRTVGSGMATLAPLSTVALAISGRVQYGVVGQGSLSSYGPAGPGLGVSGEWTNYSATASGSVAITLTTGGLILDGAALPAGTYTITTAAAAFGGSGATSSPNFAGAVAISATDGTIDLGAGTGDPTIGGAATGDGQGLTLSGYAGSVVVSADGDGTDSVTLDGTSENVLAVSSTPATISTDPNTPAGFTPIVSTSLAGSYTLTALAPSGWTVAFDASGKVTVTPAPGTQAGTYPIDVTARSSTDPNLVAQAVVDVSVTPTPPGFTLSAAPDPIFTVPFDGAQVPSAFRASIQNLGPTSDTYNLTFAGVPSGFTLQQSGTSVSVPAGRTGIDGLYLVPNAGQALPAPGTVLTFAVTATSTTDAKLTRTQVVAFTVPAIDAVTVTSTPTSVNTIPGAGVADTVAITNVGNVAEGNVTLAGAGSAGLIVNGLTPLSLAVGQAETETATLTPDASIPLNTALEATITATYGPSAAPLTQALTLPVEVVAPGVQAIANASVAANLLGDAGLVARLGDLSAALTNLVRNPTNAVDQGQAVANLDSLVSQVTGDPFLSGFTAGLSAARTALASATTAAEVQSAVGDLGTALGTFAGVITDDAEHALTLGLSPDRAIVQPGAPEVFDLLLTNKGSVATTYDLVVSGLPSGVTSQFSQATVTVQPGQSITAGANAVTLTLTEGGTTLVPASFTVTATAEGATEIAQSTPGLLTLRDTSISVAGVVTNPTFTDAGGKVDVSTTIQAAVNEPSQVSASYVVTDPGGTVLFTSAKTAVPLAVTSTVVAADLGNLDTTGFANGVDTITVTLTDASGAAVPGGTATTTLLIGQPVTGTLTTTPAVVPTGSDTVATTISVTSQKAFPLPLTLQGGVATPAPGTSVALYQAGRKTYVYESGTGGIDAIDATDPAHPQFLEAFGQNDILASGQFGFNVARVVHGELIVGTQNGNNGSEFDLLVYSLADPAAPSLVSSTPVGYRFLSDLLVNSTGTAAYVPTNGFQYRGGNIYDRFGDVIAIDLTDPARPALASALFTNQGTPDGGDPSQLGGVLVNDQIAYSTGITPGGGNVTNDTGALLVVNIADPKAMSVLNTISIPGTANLLGVAVHGNRALVIGSVGPQTSNYDPNAAPGIADNLSLTVLDIADPGHPVVLNTLDVTPEQFPSNEAGQKTDVVDLGNGDFAVSDTDADGKPALLVVDPSDPTNIIVGAAQVPSGVHGITVSGSSLYASTSAGLSIYHIDPLVSEPATITVDLPAGSAATIVPGSFNFAPSQTNTSPAGDSLVWVRSFASGNTNFTFSFQSTVSNVTAGQVVPITTGATVAYSDAGAAGTLGLPGTSITGASVISITPDSQVVAPGGVATYDVRLTNPSATAETYDLQVNDLAISAREDFSPEVMVPAQGSVDVTLSIATQVGDEPGTSPFTVTVDATIAPPPAFAQVGEITGSATSSLTVAGSAAPQPDSTAHGVVVSITPAQATAGQGMSATYTARVTNTGSASDFFTLALAGLPEGLSGRFSDSFVQVPPGAGNFRDVSFSVYASQGFAPGPYQFTVRATSESDPAITGSVGATVTVAAFGVFLSLDPDMAAPGSTFALTVENTGTVADTFDLALGGPVALVATLGQAKVTLAPGAITKVPIATTAINFATQGDLNLTGVATSEGDPAVSAGASSNIAIPATTGMTGGLTPAVQVLPIPGSASFLLVVNNTGNTEDSYSADITGMTGPISGDLLGLDGSPAMTIPIFRLPGLSSGAVVIQADASATGQGTITVRVRSLTNPALVTSQVATVNVLSSSPGPVLPATTTSLAIAPSPASVGTPVTITATVTFTTAGSAVPTGLVTFTIDGVPQPPVALRSVNGTALATLVTSSLAAGSHRIGASYGGDAGSVASVASDATALVVAGARSATTTTLSASPDPVTAGQSVAITATVVGTGGSPTPGGIVTFLEGSTVLGTASLDASGHASLTVPTALLPLAGALGLGAHAITASYAGDAGHAPSASAALDLVVDAAGPISGPSPAPTVASVRRFGFHMQPTVLRISFSGPVVAASATDPSNYELFRMGPHGRRMLGRGGPIAAKRLNYDAMSSTVTLVTSRRLNVHLPYELVVLGSGPKGVGDASGRRLAGLGGLSGTDYTTRITFATLAGPDPALSPARVASRSEHHHHPASRPSARAIDALASSGHLSSGRVARPSRR